MPLIHQVYQRRIFLELIIEIFRRRVQVESRIYVTMPVIDARKLPPQTIIY